MPAAIKLNRIIPNAIGNACIANNICSERENRVKKLQLSAKKYPDIKCNYNISTNKGM